MSEAVKSFNDKIDEIKEDREKFEILMSEFFESEDINIKELLAEMMLHVIMTRGEELQLKFKELEDRRKMYGDWDLITTPGIGGAYVSTTIHPSWTYTTTDTTQWASIGGLTGATTGTISINSSNNDLIIDNEMNHIVTCNTASSFNVADLDINSIVEDIDLQSDSKVNTKLFENAVQAMSVWSSSIAK